MNGVWLWVSGLALGIGVGGAAHHFGTTHHEEAVIKAGITEGTVICKERGNTLTCDQPGKGRIVIKLFDLWQ